MLLLDCFLRRGNDRSWSRFRLFGSGLRLCSIWTRRRIGRFRGIPTHDERHQSTPSIQSLRGIDAHLHTHTRNSSANHFWRNWDRHFGIRHLCNTRTYYIFCLCCLRLVCAIVLRIQRKRFPLTFMLSFRFSEDRIQSYDGVAILTQNRQSSKPIVATNTPFHFLVNALYPHTVHVHVRFPVANASPNGVAFHLH